MANGMLCFHSESRFYRDSESEEGARTSPPSRPFGPTESEIRVTGGNLHIGLNEDWPTLQAMGAGR